MTEQEWLEQADEEAEASRMDPKVLDPTLNGNNVGYVIVDTETGNLFKTDRGKWLWSKAGHAKNAWNVATNAGHWRVNNPYFKDQTRYRVHKAYMALGEAV